MPGEKRTAMSIEDYWSKDRTGNPSRSSERIPESPARGGDPAEDEKSLAHPKTVPQRRRNAPKNKGALGPKMIRRDEQSANEREHLAVDTAPGLHNRIRDTEKELTDVVGRREHQLETQKGDMQAFRDRRAQQETPEDREADIEESRRMMRELRERDSHFKAEYHNLQRQLADLEYRRDVLKQSREHMTSTQELMPNSLELYDLDQSVKRLLEAKIETVERDISNTREMEVHSREPKEKQYLDRLIVEGELERSKLVRELRRQNPHESHIPESKQSEIPTQTQVLPGRGEDPRQALLHYVTFPKGISGEKKRELVDDLLVVWNQTGKGVKSKHFNTEYDVPLWLDEMKGTWKWAFKNAGFPIPKKWKRKEIDSTDMYDEDFISYMDSRKGGRKAWMYSPPSKVEPLLLNWMAQQPAAEHEEQEAGVGELDGPVTYIKTSHDATHDVYSHMISDVQYESEPVGSASQAPLARHRPRGGYKRNVGGAASDTETLISLSQISTDTGTTGTSATSATGTSATSATSSSYVRPGKAPARKKKLKANRDNNVQRGKHKILPNITSPNFTLVKLAPGHFRLKALDVTQGVIEQVKSLLQRVPGKQFYVNGKIFARLAGYKEVVRLLIADGTVDVRL